MNMNAMTAAVPSVKGRTFAGVMVVAENPRRDGIVTVVERVQAVAMLPAMPASIAYTSGCLLIQSTPAAKAGRTRMTQ